MAPNLHCCACIRGPHTPLVSYRLIRACSAIMLPWLQLAGEACSGQADLHAVGPQMPSCRAGALQLGMQLPGRGMITAAHMHVQMGQAAVQCGRAPACCRSPDLAPQLGPCCWACCGRWAGGCTQGCPPARWSHRTSTAPWASQSLPGRAVSVCGACPALCCCICCLVVVVGSGQWDNNLPETSDKNQQSAAAVVRLLLSSTMRLGSVRQPCPAVLHSPPGKPAAARAAAAPVPTFDGHAVDLATPGAHAWAE